MPGPVVHLLEVVAVEHAEAHRQATVLSRAEIRLELELEAAPVEQAGERVGQRAAALTTKRQGSVDRGGGLRGEHGCNLCLLLGNLQRPAARSDQYSEILT